MQIVKFGGLGLNCVDEDVTFPFDVRTNAITLPYGAVDEDGQSAVLTPYSLTRVFKLYCGPNDPSLNEQMDALMRVAARGRLVIQALWRDGSRRQTFGKVTNITRPRRVDDAGYQEISITWFIDYPYWAASEDEPNYCDQGEFFDTGLFFDGNYTEVTIDATTETFTIENEGLVPIQRGQLVILPASGGSLTNLVLSNDANLMEWRYNGTVADPYWLYVDFLSRTCKLSAVNSYEAVEIPAGQMEWMTLETGTNELELTVESITGSVVFEWHWVRHFL